MRQSLIIAISLLVAGCKSPFDRTKDASKGGATGTFGAAPAYVIFNNELSSGGGAFEFPGGENQTLSFADTSNSISRRSIRYSWTGAPAQAGGTDHTFAGFTLMHTSVQADYSSTPGKDLRAAGYTQVSFYARGSLSTNTDLKIEVSDDGNPATPAPCITLSTSGTDDVCAASALTMPHKVLTASWQLYNISVPNPELASVKDLFKATFVFTDPFPGNLAPGQGGTVYFDVIEYKP